nr:MAG TPA: hypothetical protein [Caudoviricetes sp.]
MKKDFELLTTYGTEFIVGGIRTTIDCDFLVRPFENYMSDIWDYLEKKFPGEDFEDYPWDIDPRFERFEYDEFGTKYIVLNMGAMQEDEVDWEYDCVFVRTDVFPSYERWKMDSIRTLSEIDVSKDVQELSEEQLKKLRKEIRIGSCYLSDYNNSMSVDRNILSNYCENYEEWLEEENIEDSPEEFAYYILEVA